MFCKQCFFQNQNILAKIEYQVPLKKRGFEVDTDINFFRIYVFDGWLTLAMS